ncbi:hypothetical protein ACJX0J_033315, partial [Zea mays]
ILRGQEGGEDGAHQRDRHRRRLRACSAASGGAHHLGRVRPDLPGGQSAQGER